MTEGVTQAAAMPCRVRAVGRPSRAPPRACGRRVRRSARRRRTPSRIARRPARARSPGPTPWRQSRIAAWPGNGRDRRIASEGTAVASTSRHRRQADAAGDRLISPIDADADGRGRRRRWPADADQGRADDFGVHDDRADRAAVHAGRQPRVRETQARRTPARCRDRCVERDRRPRLPPAQSGTELEQQSRRPRRADQQAVSPRRLPSRPSRSSPGGRRRRDRPDRLAQPRHGAPADRQGRTPARERCRTGRQARLMQPVRRPPLRSRPAEQRRSGGNDAGDRKARASRAGAARCSRMHGATRRSGRVPAKVSIIAEQAAPAPAAASLSANGAAIVDAIGGEQGWRAAAHSSPAPARARARTAPSRCVAEDPAAPGGARYGHGAICAPSASSSRSSCRSTVMKPITGSAPTATRSSSRCARSASTSTGFRSSNHRQQRRRLVARRRRRRNGSFSRDTPSFQPGNSGNGGERSGGQTGERGERGGGHAQRYGSPINQDRAGSSLYI